MLRRWIAEGAAYEPHWAYLTPGRPDVPVLKNAAWPKNDIDEFEMVFRMQVAVPELADLSTEPASTFEKCGPESKKPGSYAANCILARRLAERGVRFVQLYHRGWDQHNNCPAGLKTQCYDTDQASAALLSDLKERGLLDDTLVV